MLRKFFADHRASAAPLVALSIIPIVGAVAAAVDYNRAAVARTEMQSALDSTALMLSKEARNLSAAEVNSKANAYFKALYKNSQATDLAVTANMTSPNPGSYVLDVKASASMPTRFAAILGKPTVDFSASSEAVWGIKKLNLALALDNTGSMAQDGKMDALKSSAHNLLTTLENAAQTPGDIKVSIVPFATDVDVGTNNVTSDWIDWSDWNAANGTCSYQWLHSESSCTQYGYKWTVADHSTWNGCVYDRDQNNDVSNTATISGVPATMFRAHQAYNCPTAMMPLSEDWTALNDKIDAMTPTGNTNVTIGLAMAWQTLTAANPFNAPQKADDLEKVIVLLTDGENTQNRWTTSSTSIDSRTQAVCANAKADGVKIYTIRVIDGNADLLRGCATKASMYYEVQESDQLSGVFSSIAQDLAKLRLAK